MYFVTKAYIPCTMNFESSSFPTMARAYGYSAFRDSFTVAITTCQFDQCLHSKMRRSLPFHGTRRCARFDGPEPDGLRLRECCSYICRARSLGRSRQGVDNTWRRLGESGSGDDLAGREHNFPSMTPIREFACFRLY